MFTIISPFLIILSYNSKNLSLSSNHLIFLNISFLIFFSLFKKVLVSLCLPYLSKPMGSYLFLVSLCKSCLSKPYLSKPSFSKPLKSNFVLVYLCLPYFSVSSGSLGFSLNSEFLDSSNIFNFLGYLLFIICTAGASSLLIEFLSLSTISIFCSSSYFSFSKTSIFCSSSSIVFIIFCDFVLSGPYNLSNSFEYSFIFF